MGEDIGVLSLVSLLSCSPEDIFGADGRGTGGSLRNSGATGPSVSCLLSEKILGVSGLEIVGEIKLSKKPCV
jgi:hypothetical protein